MGGIIKVFIDGTEIFSATDGSIPSGAVGLYCWGNGDDVVAGPPDDGTFFDDVKVYENIPELFLEKNSPLDFDLTPYENDAREFYRGQWRKEVTLSTPTPEADFQVKVVLEQGNRL